MNIKGVCHAPQALSNFCFGLGGVLRGGIRQLYPKQNNSFIEMKNDESTTTDDLEKQFHIQKDVSTGMGRKNKRVYKDSNIKIHTPHRKKRDLDNDSSNF